MTMNIKASSTPYIQDNAQYPFETQANLILNVGLDQVEIENEQMIVRTSLTSKIAHALGWGKKAKQAQLATKVIELIKNGLSVSKKQASHPVFSDYANDIVKRLCLEIVPQLHLNEEHKLYLRRLITKDVENLLSDKIKQLRDEKANFLNNPILNTPTHHLERKWAKAKLAVRLGLGVEGNKGENGTYLIKNISGKKILGVFKQDLRYVDTWVRFKNFFKRFFGQLSYLKNDPLVLAKGEVASYVADQHFAFNLAPATAIKTLKGRKGAFQVYIKNYIEADRIINQDPVKAEALFKTLVQRDKLADLELIQKMAVEDYLTGQLDRHEENWFLKDTPEQKLCIKLIDNANSFIKRNPQSEFDKKRLKNQYKWSSLPIAQEPFSDNIKAFILNKLTEEHIDSFIVTLAQHPHLKDFLDEDMKRLLKERARVLIKLARQQKSSPADLAKFRTDAEIHAFLAH